MASTAGEGRVRYRFAGFELDIGRREFQVAGETHSLEPQVFDLLRHFVENPDRLITRDELIEAVWDGRVVSDATVSARINAARRAVGDSGARQELIKTVPRRGFRFIVQVEGVEDSLATPAGPAPPADRPSIAVLPFDNLSGDPGEDYFADGITDDIITELSRYPDLLVIARHSTFAYKGTPTDAKVVARELGVAHVLEGGVRRAGQRLRITAQLIDAASGHNVWAERYDRDLADVFELQDEISRVIAGAVGVRLHEVGAARAARVDPASLNAYDLALRAYARFSLLGRDDIEAARSYAEEAIRIDPAYSRGYTALAWTHAQPRFSGFTHDPDRSLVLAFEAASKAVALDPADAYAAVIFAVTLLLMHKHERALAELDRAIALSPSFAEPYAQRANVLGFMGRSVEAIEAVMSAVRLNPHSPGYYHLMHGRALLAVRQFADAIAPLGRAVSLSPKMTQIHVALAVAYAGVGRDADARTEVAEIRALTPRFTRAYAGKVLPYLDHSVLDEQLALLAEAGLPE